MAWVSELKGVVRNNWTPWPYSGVSDRVFEDKAACAKQLIASIHKYARMHVEAESPVIVEVAKVNLALGREVTIGRIMFRIRET